MFSANCIAVLYIFSGFVCFTLSQRVNDPKSPYKKRGDAYLATSREDEQKVLVFATTGTEDMELIIVVDVLRRAGIDTNIACPADIITVVPLKQNISIIPDYDMDIAMRKQPYDVIILPGGPGYKQIIHDPKVKTLLAEQDKAKRFIAAMSTAMLILQFSEIGEGRNITTHPAYVTLFEDEYIVHKNELIVHDGHILTCKGPAAAIDFGLYIVEILRGTKVADQIAKNMVYQRRYKVDFGG